MRLIPTRPLVAVALLLSLATAASAQDQTFTVYSGGSASFVVPRNGPKIVADYVVEKGTATGPVFTYNDTSNCENKSSSSGGGGSPWYYSINLQNDITGSEIGTDSGTTGVVVTLYDCGCPYKNNYVCPQAEQPYVSEYLPRRKVFDVSDWTDDGPVPMTIRAQGVTIEVTVYAGKPDQGIFTAEPSLAPQIKDIDPAPPLMRGPVTHDADPVPNQTLVVPLGLPFKWGMLKRKDKSPVKATFELLVHHFDPEIPDDTEKFPGRPTVLFDDRILLSFGPEEAVEERWFIGLHLGTQYFKVTPVDPNIPPCTVRVTVKPPEQLGKPPNDLDEWFYKTAHRRGIPPQWIKAQVEKESVKIKVAGSWVWRRDTFRYEPFSADRKWISRNNRLRSKPAYERYRLPTQTDDEGLAQGADLDRPADTAFRNRYKYKRGEDAPAQITEEVDDVTASEIVLANEAPGKKGENWDQQNEKSYNEFILAFNKGTDLLPFNAQTTLGSSYGLVQMLYVSAIDGNWNNAKGEPDDAELHPAALMDTDDSLNAGDGSLHIGTALLLSRRKFASKGGNAKCTVPSFDLEKYDTHKEFQDAHESTLTTYNCAFSKDGLTYGQYVMSAAEKYMPTRKDTGFQ